MKILIIGSGGEHATAIASLRVKRQTRYIAHRETEELQSWQNA